MRLRSVLVVGLIVAAASPVMAQNSDNIQSAIPRVNLVSSNPIGLVFEWFNGEFERAVTPSVSVAAAGSHFDFDGFQYTSIDGIFRYYPTERALRGFSFGGSLGYLTASGDNDCTFGCEDDSESAFSLGVRGDYVWLLGRSQHFAVAAGIGAKRVFYSDSGSSGSVALPIGRLSIGYAW